MKRFPEVLLADCTYKTNRFNMPLLIFTGVNNVGSSFVVTFALLERETSDFFKWTLNQLFRCLGGMIVFTVISDNDGAFYKAMNLFPEIDHQLCTWHMMKRVMENMKVSLKGEAQRAQDLIYDMMHAE